MKTNYLIKRIGVVCGLLGVAVVAASMLSACSNKSLQGRSISKIENSKQSYKLSYQVMMKAALYSKLISLSKEDLNEKTFYNAIVKLAYPEYFKENQANNFSIHDRLKSALIKLENEFKPFYDKALSRATFYNYLPAKVGAYDFNKKTLALTIVSNSQIPFSLPYLAQQDFNKKYSTNVFVYYSWFLADFSRFSWYQNLLESEGNAEKIIQASKRNRGLICLKTTYTIKSIKNGEVIYTYSKGSYIDDFTLCK